MIRRNMNMQRRVKRKMREFCLAPFFWVILHLAACMSEPAAIPSSGSLLKINYSQCDRKSSPASEVFTFKMVSPGHLVIGHTGAGFNCCIKGLVADVTYTKSSIVIIERQVVEDGGECLCTCRYDISYRVPVLNGEYSIVIKTENGSSVKSNEFKMGLDGSTVLTRSAEIF